VNWQAFLKIESLIVPEPWPKGSLRVPRLQAHRGYWISGEQENTLAAIRAAKNQGALMFECDVQLSKDKVPVVFHDMDLRRIGKLDLKVADLTAKELRDKVNAPSLEEVLRDPHVPVLANIELKTNRHLNEALERKVSEVVSGLKIQHRVLFSSFNPSSLWRIKQFLPQVPRALLVSAEEKENPWYLRSMSVAPFLSFHLLHLDKRMCTETRMRRLVKNKIPFAVWTVNERDQIEFFLKQGAVSVITDSLDFSS
jgi:glycerophosphoryl diester phosphodiesterase